MKGVVRVVGLSLLAGLLVCGCGANESNNVESSVLSESSGIGIKGGLSVDRGMVTDLTNIMGSIKGNGVDYSKYFYYPSNSLVNEAIVMGILKEYNLDTLGLYELEELEISNKNKLSDGGYSITIRAIDNSEYTFDLVKDGGDYKLDISDQFVENISIRVPSVDSIYVDGIDVSSFVTLEDSGRSTILFKGIKNGIHKIEYKSEILGDIEDSFEVYIDNSNELIDKNYRLSVAEVQGLIGNVKELHSSLLEDAINDNTSDLKKLFIDGYDSELFSKYNNLDETLNVVGVPIITDIDIIDNDEYHSELISSDTVKLYYKYRVSYTKDSQSKIGSNNHTMSDGAYMEITKQGDKYLISGHSDSIIEEYNEYRDNWDTY